MLHETFSGCAGGFTCADNFYNGSSGCIYQEPIPASAPDVLRLDNREHLAVELEEGKEISGRVADKAVPERAKITRHNSGSIPHAAKFRLWRIKTAVAFTDAERAVEFERYLKTASGRAFAKKRL